MVKLSLSKIYTPLGFKKRYNFILFFIFGGGCMAFVISRTPFLDVDRIFCRFEAVVNVLQLYAAPGECYEYDHGYQRVAISLHLSSILPGMFLAVFQFLPVMRYKLMIMHRIDGYAVIALFLIANVGALMLTGNSFAGTIETQAVFGLMVLASTFAVFMAYYNIKRLQIEQHRAWMLRTFFYACTVITQRIILILSTMYTSVLGHYYYVQPCYKIAYNYHMQEHPTVDRYPACEAYFNGTNPEQRVVTRAQFFADATIGNEEIMSALDMNFGMAMWLAFFIHVVGIEIYLQLTPIENHRLRQISYQRQVEAGLRNPGFAGTPVQRIGDAPTWEPDIMKEKSSD